MCARYVLELNPIDLAKILRAALTGEDAYSPSWNIAPTRSAPILLQSRKDRSRRIEVFRWGLLPPWAAENEGAKLVNVRSETAFEKRTSAEAVIERRCVVPLSGWYEWQRTGKRPQPFYFSSPDSSVMLGAGVWNARRRDSGEFLFTLRAAHACRRGCSRRDSRSDAGDSACRCRRRLDRPRGA
jgi:putative SOS response-associated peptidase YedK